MIRSNARVAELRSVVESQAAVFEKPITESSEAAPSIASMENLQGAFPDACCFERWLQRHKQGEE
jgi:hypothetical protein